MTPLTGSPVSLQVSGIVAQTLEHCGGQPVPLRFLPDLARLTEAIDGEAALTGQGRAQVRASLVSQLVTQVEAARLLAACPGISPGRVPAPVFITGLHRTGTTLRAVQPWSVGERPYGHCPYLPERRELR